MFSLYTNNKVNSRTEVGCDRMCIPDKVVCSSEKRFSHCFPKTIISWKIFCATISFELGEEALVEGIEQVENEW